MKAAMLLLLFLAVPASADYLQDLTPEKVRILQEYLAQKQKEPSRSKKQETFYRRCRDEAVKLPSSEGVRIAIRDCEKKFPPDVNPPRP